MSNNNNLGIALSLLAQVRYITGAFGISIFATVLNNSVYRNQLIIAKYSVVKTANLLLGMEAAGLMELKAEIDGYQIVVLVAGFIMLFGALFK